MSWIGLIVLVLLIIGVCFFTKWIVTYMGVPHPASMVILVAVALLCVIGLLAAVGLLGALYQPVPRLR